MNIIDLAGMLGKSSGGSMGAETAERAPADGGSIFRDIFGRQFGGLEHSAPDAQQQPHPGAEQAATAEMEPVDIVKNPALLEALQILAVGEMLLAANAAQPAVPLTDDTAAAPDEPAPDTTPAAAAIKLPQQPELIFPDGGPAVETAGRQDAPDIPAAATTAAELSATERQFAATTMIAGAAPGPHATEPGAEQQFAATTMIAGAAPGPHATEPTAGQSAGTTDNEAGASPKLFEFTGDTKAGLTSATAQPPLPRETSAQQSATETATPQSPTQEAGTPDQPVAATTPAPAPAPATPAALDRPDPDITVNRTDRTNVTDTALPEGNRPTTGSAPGTAPAGDTPLQTNSKGTAAPQPLDLTPDTANPAPPRPEAVGATAAGMPQTTNPQQPHAPIDMPPDNNQPPAAGGQPIISGMPAEQPPQTSEAMAAEAAAQSDRRLTDTPPPAANARTPTTDTGDKAATTTVNNTTNFAAASQKHREGADSEQSQGEAALEQPPLPPAPRTPVQAAAADGTTVDFRETVRQESRTREATGDKDSVGALNDSRPMPGNNTAVTAAPPTPPAPGAGFAERVERLQEMLAGLDKHILQSIDTREKGMVIRLVPANLGSVQLSCHTDEDRIRVEMLVENGAVRSLIQQQEHNLRELLQQAGYRMDQFDVRTQSEGANSRASRERGTAARKPRAVAGGASLREEAAPAAAGAGGYRHHHDQEGVWYVA